MTKAEIYELCGENPEKWETVAKDCVDDMPFDDLEDACRRNGWKLPLDSYMYHCDLVGPHVLEMCRLAPKMWEAVAKACLDCMPADFVEYLSEERGW